MQSTRTLIPYKKEHSFKFLFSILGLFLTILALSGLSLSNSQALASVSNNYLFNQFAFGLSNDTSWTNPNFGGPSNVKVEAGPWVLDNWHDYNNQWLQKFSSSENSSKIPYLYLYVIAGNARKDWGLQDCNVGAPMQSTLCYNGANYIRNNNQHISNVYQNLANNIKSTYGTSKPILLHLEPDYFQYHQQQSGQNYPLSLQESWNYMNEWTSGIKSILPNASLVMDISPWIHYSESFATWSGGFNNFDYAGLVGGRFNADGDGSTPNGINGITYSEMSKQSGKKIIINTAHGVGGVLQDYNYSWTVPSTLQDRWNDGVVAVLQSNHDNNTLANNSNMNIGNFVNKDQNNANTGKNNSGNVGNPQVTSQANTQPNSQSQSILQSNKPSTVNVAGNAAQNVISKQRFKQNHQVKVLPIVK